MIDKGDTITLGVLFLIFGLGMIFELVLLDINKDTFPIEVLNNVCEELYGSNYEYVELINGISSSFNCDEKSIPEIKPLTSVKTIEAK